MFTLVIGGAASGKSAYAECLVMGLPGRRVYLATMRPVDQECLERIEKHRRLRHHKGFETIERWADLEGLTGLADANILLECVGNLTANELFGPEGGGRAAVLRGLESLRTRCRHLTAVTNEVFSGGGDYGEGTLFYLRELAAINRALAARADTVVEVVCGLPCVRKGGPRL